MAALDTIDIENRHLKMVKSVFARHLPYKKVWAYGSRAKWTASHTSDLDLELKSKGEDPLSISELMNFKEVIQESNIPILVQTLDWARIPDTFKKNILQNYEVLR